MNLKKIRVKLCTLFTLKEMFNPRLNEIKIVACAPDFSLFTPYRIPDGLPLNNSFD